MLLTCCRMMEVNTFIQTNGGNEYAQSHTACKIDLTVHEGEDCSINSYTVSIVNTELVSVANPAEQERKKGIRFSPVCGLLIFFQMKCWLRSKGTCFFSLILHSGFFVCFHSSFFTFMQDTLKLRNIYWLPMPFFFFFPKWK